MMKSARLDQLSAQAATVGARINRTGDGAYIILHCGQRHLVVSLGAVEVVLRQLSTDDKTVAPQRAARKPRAANSWQGQA